MAQKSTFGIDGAFVKKLAFELSAPLVLSRTRRQLNEVDALFDGAIEEVKTELVEAEYEKSYSAYGFQSIWKNGEEEEEEADEDDEEEEEEKEEEEEEEDEAKARGAVLFAARFMHPALRKIYWSANSSRHPWRVLRRHSHGAMGCGSAHRPRRVPCASPWIPYSGELRGA
jgi:ribosomal protein L12E/L44/L45/RPP1/RPP2